MAGHDKTEKATPKRRAEARRKGQVARSIDLQSAVVVLAGLVGLSAFGPRLVDHLKDSMRAALALTATPDVVSFGGLGSLMGGMLGPALTALAPIVALMAVAGAGTAVAQVKWKPSTHALKPDPKRLNPLQGAKQIFGPAGLVNGGKSIAKVLAVGVVVALAVFPQLTQLGALVGMPPAALAAKLTSMVLTIALRATAVYLLIGAIDYVYQRRRLEKSLKMDKQEVKEEAKQHALPAEVRSALRRRQLQAARARMMAAVPQADVVVTNPTHYAVALLYDGSKPAPEVIAKGQDLVAAQIRRIAEEHDVPIVPDPPLARSLHASVEVGQQIPEELFQAVAAVLAFVYRVARRKVRA